MLEKKEIVDQIEITRDGHVQVRQATLIVEDGVEIAKTYHRHVLSPGDSIDAEEDRVKAVAAAVWTPQVVEAYHKTLQPLQRAG